MYLPFALVSQGLFEQARKGLTDNTFAGIHSLSWFDWAILIPYFAILCVLSLYGLHRYEVIHTFFKHRANELVDFLAWVTQNKGIAEVTATLSGGKSGGIILTTWSLAT